MGFDYQKYRLRLDIQRELLANRYLLNAILTNIFAIEDRLRDKEKIFSRALTSKDKKALTKLNKESEVIQFENFSIPMSQYKALVNRFNPEVVTDAAMVLESYIKTNTKPLKSYYNKLKTLCETLDKKKQITSHFNSIIDQINNLNYDELETKEQAQAYIANLPPHLRNLDKGTQYLKDKFNL